VASAYFLTGLALIHVVIPVLPIPPKLDRVREEIKGWDQLGQKVGQIQGQMPDPQNTFLFGTRYQVASELAFYTPGQPETVSINRWDRPNVYDYWWVDKDLIGNDAIGILASKGKREKLLEVFHRVDSPEKITLKINSIWFDSDSTTAPSKSWYAYRCYGFKGGLRWVPPDESDIRVVTPPTLQ
jgi:undecaprenyl-diphosphatase